MFLLLLPSGVHCILRLVDYENFYCNHFFMTFICNCNAKYAVSSRMLFCYSRQMSVMKLTSQAHIVTASIHLNEIEMEILISQTLFWMCLAILKPNQSHSDVKHEDTSWYFQIDLWKLCNFSGFVLLIRIKIFFLVF